MHFQLLSVNQLRIAKLSYKLKSIIIVNRISQIILGADSCASLHRRSIKPKELRKTEIRYITKERQGRFRGHYLVDLSIIHNEIRNP